MWLKGPDDTEVGGMGTVAKTMEDKRISNQQPLSRHGGWRGKKIPKTGEQEAKKKKRKGLWSLLKKKKKRVKFQKIQSRKIGTANRIRRSGAKVLQVRTISAAR